MTTDKSLLIKDSLKTQFLDYLEKSQDKNLIKVANSEKSDQFELRESHTRYILTETNICQYRERYSDSALPKSPRPKLEKH